MKIQLANSLFDQGVLTEMYKSGFLPVKFFNYREIYLWVDLQMQTRGICKNQAVLEAEIKFNKDEMTIWRAVRSFTK